MMKKTLNINNKYKKENTEKFNSVLSKIKEYSESNRFKYREKFMFIDVIELNDKEWGSSGLYKSPKDRNS